MSRVTKQTATDLAYAFGLYFHARKTDSHQEVIDFARRLGAAQKAAGITLVDEVQFDLAIKMAQHFLEKEKQA
jgi:2-keto-3-deoxy-L-rhamnonate aldolase RhmA